MWRQRALPPVELRFHPRRAPPRAGSGGAPCQAGILAERGSRSLIELRAGSSPTRRCPTAQARACAARGARRHRVPGSGALRPGATRARAGASGAHLAHPAHRRVRAPGAPHPARLRRHRQRAPIARYRPDSTSGCASSVLTGPRVGAGFGARATGASWPGGDRGYQGCPDAAHPRRLRRPLAELRRRGARQRGSLLHGATRRARRPPAQPQDGRSGARHLRVREGRPHPARGRHHEHRVGGPLQGGPRPDRGEAGQGQAVEEARHGQARHARVARRHERRLRPGAGLHAHAGATAALRGHR